MGTDLTQIENKLRIILQARSANLKSRVDKSGHLEVAGTKEVMQGKQKVQGHYFASVIRKPKDVRLYFFPIYTHVDDFNISADLSKALKGKSCFHFKKLTSDLEKEINEMVTLGVNLYLKDELI